MRIKERTDNMEKIWEAELQHDHNLIHKPWENPYDASDDLEEPFSNQEPWFFVKTLNNKPHYIMEEISKYLVARLTPAGIKEIHALRKGREFREMDILFRGCKHVSIPSVRFLQG